LQSRVYIEAYPDGGKDREGDWILAASKSERKEGGQPAVATAYHTGDLTLDGFMERYLGGVEKEFGPDDKLFAVLDLKPGEARRGGDGEIIAQIQRSGKREQFRALSGGDGNG
jgi:hypothetical protein